LHIKITELDWILQLAIQYFKNSFLPIPQPLWNWTIFHQTITNPPKKSSYIVFQLFANVLKWNVFWTHTIDWALVCKLDITSTYLKPGNS